ncbi:MAG: biopolymer transporter ExbD [Proteobacteria bacterium]|nr:biopolymer transporter ExbD [Pseudomonadota bacterium]
MAAENVNSATQSVTENANDAVLLARAAARRKERRGGPDSKSGLSMNSLMDMMTIILVFLLKSYGEDPIVVLPNTDVPISIAQVTPEDMTVLTINKEGIFMVRQRVVELEEGRVPGNFKKGGEGGLIIEPLEVALRQEAERQRTFAMATGSTFEGDMTIVADQVTNYRLLVEVMQTAIGADFKRFRFAVIQGDMAHSGRYAGAPQL